MLQCKKEMNIPECRWLGADKRHSKPWIALSSGEDGQQHNVPWIASSNATHLTCEFIETSGVFYGRFHGSQVVRDTRLNFARLSLF
jgi:hypothetical protein